MFPADLIRANLSMISRLRHFHYRQALPAECCSRRQASWHSTCTCHLVTNINPRILLHPALKRRQIVLAMGVFSRIPESLLKMRLLLGEEVFMLIEKIFGVEALKHMCFKLSLCNCYGLF